MERNKIVFFLVGVSLVLPLFSNADYGYLTMPVDPSALSYFNGNAGINSWFDHTYPGEQSQGSSSTISSSIFTRFDGFQATGTAADPFNCTNGVGCYNGHDGIDFPVATGTNVLASASGTVHQAQWQDPSVTTSGVGYFVRIWHSQYNLSTLYGHLDATSSAGIVSTGTAVIRGQLIAHSGNTGDSTGAHLHFAVYDTDSTGSINTIDPFGWTGALQATDTWPNDIGYLWASKFATSSVVHYVTSSFTMNVSTTWNADQIYIIQDSLVVSSSAVLTIKQGAVVKFKPNGTLEVSKGKLDVQGTSTDPVYFTSIKDDAVGGDMNDDATATTPSTGDWGYIQLDAKSTTTMQNAIIRYGGALLNPAFADVYMNGGYLAATSTTFASSTYYGLHVASGTVKITSSTFSSCGQWAFILNYNETGNVTITSSTFADNTTTSYGPGDLDFTTGPTFTLTGNTSTRNYRNAWTLNGYNGANATLGADSMPYILGLNNFTVSSTKTLTVNPNVIVKFEGPGEWVVDGTLKVLGTTSTNKVYFTSIKDDSVGGDTNNDGASTTPAVQDWYSIFLDPGSSSTFNYAMVRYGGKITGTENADIYEGGGKLTVWHSTIASSSNYGIQVASGTLTISSSTLQGDGTTSTLAIYNSTNATSSATAKQNWWSSSNGPYNASSHPTGTTDGVGDHITFLPWLTSAP